MVPLDNAASNPPGREPEFIPGGNPAADAGQAKHPPDTAAGVQETGKGGPENEEPGGNDSETPPAPEPENDPTPYDSAWRTIIVKTPELLIPFINEVFGTDYSANAQVILTPNEHFMARQDGETRKRITDSSVILREQILSGDALEIRDDVKTGHYLTEVEAKPSNERVLIRIFEYAVQVGADQEGKTETGTLKIRLPHIAVLFLRSNRNTPEQMEILIETDQGSVGATVHVVKLASYTIDDIFEKNLFLLLPFLLFQYEKDFAEIERDDEKYRELMARLREIYTRLEDASAQGNSGTDRGRVYPDEYARRILAEMTRHVINTLAEKYPKIRKGVNRIMGGIVLHTSADDILERGLMQGREQGIDQGIDQGIATVAKNMLADRMPGSFISKYTKLGRNAIDKIAQELNLTVSWDEAAAKL